MKKALFTSFVVLCLLSAVFLMGLALNVQIAKADYTWTETIYIRADGSIEPDTAPISSADNMTYTLTDNIVGDVPEGSSAIVVERNSIVIDGAGYTIEGTKADFSKGISLSNVNNVTIKNTNIKSFDWSGIQQLNTLNNTIYRNNITDNGAGVLLGNSSYNVITGNNMTNNGYGVNMIHYVGVSQSNTISRNNITNNYYGYFCVSARNNTVSGNTITNNSVVGVDLTGSCDNTFYGNNIMNNEVGVQFWSSCNNSISANNLMNNNDCAISFDSSSDNNTICRNNITNNNHGIYVMYSSNNSIFNNNLLSNTYQTYTHMSVNVWDSGLEGNYWSDYAGVDLYSGPYQNETGSDGIGDTSYEIDVENQDNYPLMGMFSGFDATSEYHVQTICNSTISAFQFNGTAISFNVTGEDGTMGFCRTCIPTAVMNDTYTVLVNGTAVPFSLLPCSNSTHSYLYFSYSHSTQDVVIIPELPSVLIVPLLMALTLGIAVLLKKKGL